MHWPKNGLGMILIKKCTAFLLALVLSAVLVACGEQSSSVSANAGLPVDGQDQSPVQSQIEPEEPREELQELQPLPLASGINALTGLPAGETLADGQRPVAVMVSNNPPSYPQRGLAAADVLVEMVTEGGITRLMAMYADYSTMPQVGPVRSTRDQFVQFALPTGAVQVHIGTSVYARNLLAVTGVQTVDGIYLGKTSFWFDEQRTLPKGEGKANEYCWFTDAQLVWNGLEHEDIAPTGEVSQLFRFAQNPATASTEAGVVNAIYSSEMWSGFIYDPETGLYGKTSLGSWHTDEDGAQISFTNLFILNCNITMKADGMLSEFDFYKGTGLYVTAGGVQEITWQKGGPVDALRLLDSNGRELEVQPGKSYIGFVPDDGNSVNYLPLEAG